MKKALFSFIAMCCFFAAIAQEENWVILPWQFSLIPGGGSYYLTRVPTTGLNAGNAVESPSQGELFYIAGSTVYDTYNGTGEIFGTLPSAFVVNEGDTNFYSGTTFETALVPVPGTCRKFYAFFVSEGKESSFDDPVPGALMYTVIDASAGTIDAPANPIIDYGEGDDGWATGIAVSQEYSGVRYLYWATEDNLFRYTVSSTGIGSKVTIASSSGSPTSGAPWAYGDFDCTQLVLSSNGTTLAWGTNTGSKLFEIQLSSNTSTTILNAYQYPAFGNTPPAAFTNIYGCDFAPNGDVYAVAAGTYSNPGGIFRCSNPSGHSFSPSQFSSTSSYTLSQIDLGADGNMHVYNNSGVLYQFAPVSIGTTLTLSESFDGLATCTSTPLNYSFMEGYVPEYLLPDQVNGDNYSYFFGEPFPVGSFQINSTAVACSTATAFYSCDAMTLDNSSTGVSDYQIIITPCNAAGTPTGGADYTSAWLSTCPTNLLDLPGTNGTWLASNVGYYIITINVENACGDEGAATCMFIRVSGAPDAADANLTINGFEGATCFSQTYSSPCGAGCYSAAFNIGVGSVGAGVNNFTSYQWSLKQYNCATGGGLYIALYNGPTVPVSGGILAGINLNSVGMPEFDPHTDYFGTNCVAVQGSCYKLTVTVTNPCGSYTTYSDLDINGEYLPGPNNNNNQTREMPLGTNTTGNWAVSVYPNPANAQTIFDLQLDKTTPVTLQIFDLSGQLVASPLQNTAFEAGEHQVPVALNKLADGAYLYHITTGTGETQTGRIVKLE